MAALLSRFAGPGRVDWIGLRPGRRVPMVAVEAVEITETGLTGDRRETPGKRAVTLIQAEHIPVISALARNVATPELLRRNLVISGLNLLALRKAEFRIGTAILRGTGLCAPCSRMEEALGEGGYNAVRGHGGITAELVEPGHVALGDETRPIPV